MKALLFFSLLLQSCGSISLISQLNAPRFRRPTAPKPTYRVHVDLKAGRQYGKNQKLQNEYEALIAKKHGFDGMISDAISKGLESDAIAALRAGKDKWYDANRLSELEKMRSAWIESLERPAKIKQSKDQTDETGLLLTKD